MAGEAQVGAGGPAPGVQILDLAKAHAAAGEAQALKGGLQHVHGPGVGGGDRGAADQGPREVDNIQSHAPR